MQPESGIKTWQWVVTAIVVIVLIVIGIMVFGNKGAQAPAPGSSSTASTASTNAPGVNNIVMADQYPGNVAYLSSVQLASPGWVVVQKDNGGVPGAIIGQAYATAGISPVKVSLSEAMVDGGTYYATLYSASSATKFDPAVDKPLTDSNGSTITRVFHASATASANLKG
ncbi:MAG: hypothetical protein KGI69_02520 [Patescibacteria group bacterium]|nr:hypothetical protein [Patescibacteria group bacterium]